MQAPLLDKLKLFMFDVKAFKVEVSDVIKIQYFDESMLAKTQVFVITSEGFFLS